MKNILLIIIFVTLCGSVYSQDLIVTHERDSINCKIKKVNEDYIHFVFKNNGEIRTTLIALYDVKDFQYSYYKSSDVTMHIQRKIDYKRFKLAFNGGYGLRTAPTADGLSSEQKKHVRGLRNGYHVGIDATGYVSEPVGIGVKGVLFGSSNTTHQYIGGGNSYAKFNENIKVLYVGPTLSTRIVNHNKKNSLNFALSVGYMGYFDNATIDAYNKVSLSGNTLGFSYDIGYEIGLSKNVALGLQISLFAGKLTRAKISDGKSTQKIDLHKEEQEGLDRIDFTIGLRFLK